MAIDYEAEFAKNFLYACKKDGISIEYPELDNRKYRTNYDRVVNEIMQTNPIEDNKNYSAISYDEVVYRAVVIVKYLLGNAVTDKELMEAIELIVKSESKAVMDGYCLDITDMSAGKRRDILSIPGMNKTASVVCLVGVLIHYFERKQRGKTYSSYKHTFTMSYLAEAVASHLLDREDEKNDMLNKLRGIRLDAIKFQQNAAKDLETTIKVYPFIKENPEFKSMYAYEKSRDYAFMMGFVNQVCLLDRYLEDERTLLNKVNEIFKGELDVSGLLTYYGIDLSKREVTEEVIGVVKKYK